MSCARSFVQRILKCLGRHRAKSLGEAEAALDELESLWAEKYPIVIKSWRTKWQHLSAYFKYPEDIRRIIYTTNSIEAVHRQFRNRL